MFLNTFFSKIIIFAAFNLWKDVFRDFLEQNQAIFRVLPRKDNNVEYFGEFLELNQRFLRLSTKKLQFQSFLDIFGEF